MDNIKVSQRIEFECSYIYQNRMNAHRYRLEATVCKFKLDPSDATVIDFSKFKNYLKAVVFNEVFIYDYTTDNVGRRVGIILKEFNIPTAKVPFEISAENLVNYFVTRLQNLLDSDNTDVIVTDMKLREDSESFSEWHYRGL